MVTPKITDPQWMWTAAGLSFRRARGCRASGKGADSPVIYLAARCCVQPVLLGAAALAMPPANAGVSQT